MREYELNGGSVPYSNTEYTLAPPTYAQRPTSMQQHYSVDASDSYYAPSTQLVYQSVGRNDFIYNNTGFAVADKIVRRCLHSE